MSRSNSKYVGVDGCKAGWFSVGFDEKDNVEYKVFAKFADLVAYYNKAYLILVDIRIGLSDETGHRDCDSEARKKLGKPRSSSVFPVPSREAARQLRSNRDYEVAKSVAKQLMGKMINQQTHNIIPKIGEVDDFLLDRKGDEPPEIREAHPELCFWALNQNQAMCHKKTRREGRRERKEVLKRIQPRTDEIYRCTMDKFMRKCVAKDDILDALVAAVTAREVCLGKRYLLRTLPAMPPKDSKGLRMEMVYAEKIKEE